MVRSALVCLATSVIALAACGGTKTFPSLCSAVPPPQACSMKCDPSPGAADTCPAGFFCDPNGMCNAECTPNGGQCGSGYTCTDNGQCVSTGGCTGLACQVAKCEAMGMPATTISGQVFAPNGTLPLYGIQVYVPNSDPGPLQAGAVCDRCSDGLPGDPIVQGTTDEDGKFSLADVPNGSNIPLVIVSGKWRRQLVLPTVNMCTDNPVGATDTTLPKSKDDMTPDTKPGGIDMPKIAITTGSADALECLIRKLGIADKEIGTAGGSQQVALYSDTMSGSGVGASSFAAGFAGGAGNFADAQTLWNTQAALMTYDIVIFSCEGAQHSETKSQAAMNAVKAYADAGGRIFMSHWHNIWIEGATVDGTGQAPPVWTTIATWDDGGNVNDSITDTIDEINNPKGASFATWMLNVMGSTTRDQIPVTSARATAAGVDNTKAERWTYYQPTNAPQNFQFTTPNETDTNDRCGKVVFSDMHVSGDSTSSPGTPYPGGCASGALTPQEKALAFMFFDISSCVGQIF